CRLPWPRGGANPACARGHGRRQDALRRGARRAAQKARPKDEGAGDLAAERLEGADDLFVLGFGDAPEGEEDAATLDPRDDGQLSRAERRRESVGGGRGARESDGLRG